MAVKKLICALLVTATAYSVSGITATGTRTRPGIIAVSCGEKIMIPAALTPQDVSQILQISLSAVYKNKHRLGGFYLPGIKVLRFSAEVIYGISQGKEGLAVRR